MSPRRRRVVVVAALGLAPLAALLALFTEAAPAPAKPAPPELGLLDLLCSARKFRAPEALSLGLVSRVIADDKLMAETRAYARLLADTVSPRSVAVMKRQLWEAQFQTLSEATVQANHEMELSFQTTDFKEGVAHYLEKRAARFTGR